MADKILSLIGWATALYFIFCVFATVYWIGWGVGFRKADEMHRGTP